MLYPSQYLLVAQLQKAVAQTQPSVKEKEVPVNISIRFAQLKKRVCFTRWRKTDTFGFMTFPSPFCTD